MMTKERLEKWNSIGFDWEEQPRGWIAQNRNQQREVESEKVGVAVLPLSARSPLVFASSAK
jgi:hypothetical protein